MHAIEALQTIQPTGPLERVMTWFLLQAYRGGLRAIVGNAAAWVTEEILNASG